MAVPLLAPLAVAPLLRDTVITRALIRTLEIASKKIHESSTAPLLTWSRRATLFVRHEGCKPASGRRGLDCDCADRAGCGGIGWVGVQTNHVFTAYTNDRHASILHINVRKKCSKQLTCAKRSVWRGVPRSETRRRGDHHHQHSPLSRRHWVGGGSGGGLSCRIRSKQGHVCRNAAVSLGRRHRSKGDSSVGCSGHEKRCYRAVR